MKNCFYSVAIAAALVGFAGPIQAEAAKAKSVDVVIIIKNEKSSALVFFASSEKDVSISTNLLKDVIPPNGSAKVNIGKACKVMITADFEDETSIEPVEHDFCKDKVLKFIETKE